MWPCYRVQITVCMAHLVYDSVSQCIHALTIPTPARSLFRNLFYGGLFPFFLIKILSSCYVLLPTHLRLMRNPHTCALTNDFQQLVRSAPSVFPPIKSKRYKSQSTLKTKLKCTIPENSMTIGGCFKCYTYHITVL